MFFIDKVLEDALRGRILENGYAGGFFDCRIGVVECQQESPEGTGADFTESFGTLHSDGSVGLLGYAFDKHELALGPEVLDGQQGTAPHSLVFVKKAPVEERQQTFGFQVGDLIRVVRRLLTQDVQ